MLGREEVLKGLTGKSLTTPWTLDTYKTVKSYYHLGYVNLAALNIGEAESTDRKHGSLSFTI